MARFVAKIILLTIFLIVILMTYLSMRSAEQGPYRAVRNYDQRESYHAEQPIFKRVKDRQPSNRRKPPEHQYHHQEGIHVVHPDGLIEDELQDNQDTGVLIPDPQEGDTLDKNQDLSFNSSLTGGKVDVFVMPLTTGENIVSMSLYGSNPRYTMGAIRNAELIKVNFPGWKLRIYTGNPSDTRHEAIPSNVMKSLRALGVDFYFMEHHEDFIPPMMWRFLVADDLWVDRFIVRDSDARLTQRDAAAVYAWMKSDKPFTCIRDHPSHAGYAVSGGMWGGKPQEMRNILRRSWRDLMRGVPSQYLQDMSFLENVVWPKVMNHSYCVDSVSCDKWPGAYPFPIPRFGYEHVGQVVNEHDLGRPQDIQILRNADVNKKCAPPKLY